MIRLVLLSRTGGWLAAATAGTWALAVAVGRWAVRLDLSPTFPPGKLVMVELCVIVGAVVFAMLGRSRFWEWERVARGHRARAAAAVIAGASIVLVAVSVLVVAPFLPDGATWGWVLGNAVTLAAAVLLVSAWTTPLIAGAVTMAGWLSCAVVANLAPTVWLPLADYRDQAVRWPVAVGLVVAAVGVHGWTCGITRWAHRRFETE